jgi:hypothetical protein
MTRISLLTALLLSLTSLPALAHNPPDAHHEHSHVVPGWGQGEDTGHLGSTHGGVVIDKAGLVYSNTDTPRSIIVHHPDGSFARSMADKYPGIHGMTMVEENGKEYIYAAHLAGHQVLKLRLDGTLVWALGVPMESGKYDDNPNAYAPTAVAVAPDGTIYVADGYGRQWVHIFRPDLSYVKTIGGPGSEPGKFKTCHGLAVDTRGEEPLLLVCDRENRRIQRFHLDGTHKDVAIEGLRRPCAMSIRGKELAVAELEGRVTILDENFDVIEHVGNNPDKTQWANHGVPPEAWSEGIFTAPHGCCLDHDGNLYVSDWNATGRLSKIKRAKD